MKFDLIFVGGGLSACLAAYRLAETHPDWRLAVVERDAVLGGNHTWCFHGTDVTDAQRAWLDPFITHRWEGQDVRFPRRKRCLSTPYLSANAERLRAVMAASPVHVFTGQGAEALSLTKVTLGNQETLEGTIIDARGQRDAPHLSLGFQKFLGLEVRFAEPHGLRRPIIMDATVPQTDGYRFVYVLPFSDDTALIEDTYYADGAAYSPEELRRGIDAYARAQGWTIAEVLREEEGVLPIVLEGDIEAHLARSEDAPPYAGLRAALFHPVTGYSLPEAARLADLLAGMGTPSPQSVAQILDRQARARWRAHRFSRLLNRMLFRAAEPSLRYIVLERFYGLPQGLIERFYAGQSTLGDQARILAGKPPVPIGRAIKAIIPERPAGTVKA